MRLRPALIAVEGIDGSGKSGVVRHLAAHLRSLGADVLATREPGGTPEGESLRALVLAGKDETWEPASELLLMTAARVQHVRRVIEPALARGQIVVTDRFVGSTLAYQGKGRGLSTGFILDLHRQAVGDLWPDLTLILDLDVATGLGRSRHRLSTDAIDEGRFEGLDLGFHESIRSAFRDQALEAPERHALIDASGTPVEVQAAALAAVLGRLSAQPPA